MSRDEILSDIHTAKLEKAFMERLYQATDGLDTYGIVAGRLDELSDEIWTLEREYLAEFPEPDYDTIDRNAYHARTL